MILVKSRAITGADAGSLYLVEETPEGDRQLRFKLTQNDSRQFPFTEFTMPISEGSMAGYVALHGEVIQVGDAYTLLAESDAPEPYQFNPKYDQESGYRTRSMLTLPMKNGKGEVLGVLQLINCKSDPEARLTSLEAVEHEVQAFPERAVRLALSLASQAAVAYENSRLYQDIETLFEGFVQAAVTAIEQRDPTTSGHSQRVSTMTVGLAETVDRVDCGAYARISFSREQLKEIRYAALLHDFGKVGVREEVLVKAKKLYPLQYARLMDRFDYIRRDIEANAAEKKVDALLKLSKKDAAERIKAIDAEAAVLLTELERCAEFVARANEPTVMPSSDVGFIGDIAGRTYRDRCGSQRPYLTEDEVQLLAIPRGSLAPDERRQIESHVVHSFQFLV